MIQELADQGAGEVVGDVPNHHLSPIRIALDQIELEDVCLDNLHPGATADHLTQRRDQRAIELDGGHTTVAISQRNRQRADPRPNLDHLVRLVARTRRHLVAQVGVDQEVLSQPVLQVDAMPSQQP